MFRLCMLLVLFYANFAQAADANLILKVLICESGLKHDAIGDDGVSRGIAQFRKETFEEFAKQAHLNKAGLGKPDWMNPQQQVYLLRWGIDHGYGRRWTCFRKLTQR